MFLIFIFSIVDDEYCEYQCWSLLLDPLGRPDQMLVEQVVQVDLPEDVRFEVLVDGLGLQLILEHAHLHQEQRYHPLLHQDLKRARHFLLRTFLEQLTQALVLQERGSQGETPVLELSGKVLPPEVLDDLVAFGVDVGDEVEHLELKLLGADVHDVVDSMDLVRVFLAFTQALVLLNQLTLVLLDNPLNFFLFSKDFQLYLRLPHALGLAILHLVLAHQLVLNPGEIFLHAVHEDGSMVFHQYLLEASTTLKFKANEFLTVAPLDGKLLDPQVVETDQPIEIFIHVGELEGEVVAQGEVVHDEGAGEDGGKLTETGMVVAS